MAVRVLLVDDETIDLEWMRRRVLSGGLDIELAGAVTSGFAALERLKEQPVDLILSDIRMPIMTGTEFARRAKVINPKLKIVFISGHEEFDYAREAIEISASAYLLKPVKDEDLYATLNRLCEQLRQEGERDRSMLEALSLVQEELLLRWFEDDEYAAPAPHLRAVVEPLLAEGSAAAVIEIDDAEWKLGEDGEDGRRRWTRRIAALIRSCAAEEQLGTLIPHGPARFVLLAARPAAAFSAGLQGLIREVEQSCGHTITIGLGPHADDEAGLYRSYRRAAEALSTKWLLGKNRLIANEASFAANDRPDGRKPAEAPENETGEPAVPAAAGAGIEASAQRLIDAILGYDLVAIDDGLLELFRSDAASAGAGKRRVYELIVRLTSILHADLQRRSENLYELLEWDSHNPELLFRFETVHDIRSWLRRRFFELSELLYVKSQRQKRKLIDEMIRYAEARPEQKITLKEAAAHFDFTPNYLGHLFKEETGVSFGEHVNELRNTRVCELLRDPTLRIYEIAERMGYKNMIYFNRQFKLNTGMTPGEYRKKNRI
ncbi:response regulator [Saccharibacillus sp. CPCC 101409]|uniref:response regulator n=1 Tax=Saccharibacillus sp. CPCC 101409 TaxID=3058041 RepID=UPI0026712E5C|nr:response regulator [Saccharibacillus sp. CPCC 101409]MDO3409289.1 response regulator [Saccharibacillus sp. CPCC 101409]